MKRLTCSALVGLLFVCWPAVASAQDKPQKDNKPPEPPKTLSLQKTTADVPLCPVSGEEIDRSVSVDYRGKKVYFCCADCIASFQKDPEKYAQGVKDQWAAMRPLRVQVRCPISGKPISLKAKLDGEDGSVYFCCEKCPAKWEPDNPALKAKLESCYTYQTTCPISGKEIDVSTATEIDGRTVYFCCPKCPDAFKKDTAANFKKLDEQIKANQTAFAQRRAQPRGDDQKGHEYKHGEHEKKGGG